MELSAEGVVGRLLLTAACLAPSMAASAEPVACPAPSRAVFACSTGAKRVAVCASPGLSTTEGTLQYRFGPRDRAELALPADAAAWRGITHAQTLSYSGGGGAVIAFDRPPYRYAVYSAIGRGWGSRAGVVVSKAGRTIAALTCRGHVDSDLGPELFERAGIAADTEPFQLP